MKETLTGIVERITYSNQENGYAVIKIKVEKVQELVTVVGNLALVSVGTVIKAKGAWIFDAKFGKQFRAEAYEEALPSTLLGIEKYLGSGLIKGIGPGYAKKIMGQFREKTIEIIEKQPDRLQEIEGIGEKRIAMIKQGWADQKEIKNVMIFLQSHGISATYAVKIFKNYGNKSIAVLQENPYRLADDIWGIGFKTADRIAGNMGFAPDSYARCRSAFLYILNEAAGNGHCYLEEQAILEEGEKILEADPLLLREHLKTALEDGSLIREKEAIYLPPMFYSEIAAAKKIKEIAKASNTYQYLEIGDTLEAISREEKIEYDIIQQEAITRALRSKFMVLTGGPGTGKTTTTLAIIKAFQHLGARVLLAAPTGRAAKRLSEATRMEAKTIHRLLEFSPGEGYKKNQDAPLEGEVLIIDEASMIDLLLMHNLLKAIRPEMNVVLVGDVDQLPSVGAGNVLKDMIRSRSVPVVKLERIFRQAQDSEIVVNAHRINKGTFPVLKQEKDSDFFFIEEGDPARLVSIIKELIEKRLPKYYGVNPIHDIQVLTPMQRGETGTQNLNRVLQETLNKSRESIQVGADVFYLGDKVMQIKNNYDKSVFNGDIGIITKINKEDGIVTVQFDPMLASYEKSELDELVLAYAVTVHKSQGSEYPIVIAPLTTQHYMMLQRNLLYTCVTRAKKVMVLIGTKKAVFMAVKNDKITQRNTRLAELLQ